MYAKYVVPYFSSIPNTVEKYLKKHQFILKEHKNWIGSHIAPYL